MKGAYKSMMNSDRQVGKMQVMKKYMVGIREVSKWSVYV
jgi:hypothetical protein